MHTKQKCIVKLSETMTKPMAIRRASGFFVASAMMCLLPVNATGQSANITFSGDPSVIGSSCTIQVLSNGRISASPNLRNLDSRRWGGFGAEILVTSRQPGAATGPGFEITFDPPSDFAIAPAGTTSNIRWRVWHQGTSVSDGINFGRTRGFNARTLPNTGISVTQITGHLRARNNDGIFGEGFYRAIGTYRCE